MSLLPLSKIHTVATPELAEFYESIGVHASRKCMESELTQLSIESLLVQGKAKMLTAVDCMRDHDYLRNQIRFSASNGRNRGDPHQKRRRLLTLEQDSQSSQASHSTLKSINIVMIILASITCCMMN